MNLIFLSAAISICIAMIFIFIISLIDEEKSLEGY